jgi:hypothetical protein
VLAGEGPVVEADDVGEGSRHPPALTRCPSPSPRARAGVTPAGRLRTSLGPLLRERGGGGLGGAPARRCGSGSRARAGSTGPRGRQSKRALRRAPPAPARSGTCGTRQRRADGFPAMPYRSRCEGPCARRSSTRCRLPTPIAGSHDRRSAPHKPLGSALRRGAEATMHHPARGCSACREGEAPVLSMHDRHGSGA